LHQAKQIGGRGGSDNARLIGADRRDRRWRRASGNRQHLANKRDGLLPARLLDAPDTRLVFGLAAFVSAGSNPRARAIRRAARRIRTCDGRVRGVMPTGDQRSWWL